MRVCVYGAASDLIDRKYINAVEDLCCELGKKGHSLVFGGGGVGVMGAAARGFHKGGGEVVGVVPRFFKEQGIEDLYEKCDKFIYTYTLSERKNIMEDSAQAYIIGPGGIGTYDEFFEALTLKQLGIHKKPIAVFNVDGFYDPMQKMMEHARDEKFLRDNAMSCYGLFDKIEDLIKYIEDEFNAE